ncbi:unnamed protein product (macronuclear) [Paramecium tetraurelia]|uniref:Transmembrane protein n=1 Tax=Paramecium tetraurelia TaxID=5888 RepID=A0CR06_PARTE|nr:uncharacterized protein GSPATT00038880001 [Paramecium tetraurelia]CAK73223.1 unnamed protein product [Paramecium tetraurelia]|eukprot:XP_001440620.1 hypothetical protein (macronuclear) [Paramecium tetraurelia strain d4-2]
MINQYLYEECNEFSIKFIIALLTLKLFIKSLDFIDYIQIQLIILMQLCFKTQSSNLSSNIITCYFLVQDNLQRFQQSNLQYLFSLNYTKRIYDFLNCYYVSYFSHNNSIFQWHFLFFQQLNNLQLRAKKKNSTNNDINLLIQFFNLTQNIKNKKHCHQISFIYSKIKKNSENYNFKRCQQDLVHYLYLDNQYNSTYEQRQNIILQRFQLLPILQMYHQIWVSILIMQLSKFLNCQEYTKSSELQLFNFTFNLKISLHFSAILQVDSLQKE